MRKAIPGVKIFNKDSARKLLPGISVTDNKSSRGRSLLLAGSPEYPGAGVLAARGALRGGSGYVTLAQKNISISSLENPDFLVVDLSTKSWSDISYQAILVGPGFGVNSFTADVIRKLKKQKTTHVILDADALTVCAQEKLFPLPASWIVTPHGGELARCLGISVAEVNNDRQGAILKAHTQIGCVVLLKGHGSLIFNGEHLFRIASGNPGLAKSGTGDVLAGLITAFRAQGLSALDSATLGAYVHGATANLWVAQHKDPLSLTASDVLDLIPRVLYRLRLKD